MPFGAEITKDGVRFALWAPTAQRVDLVIEGRRVAMPAIGQGWYKMTDAAAAIGDRYGFAIDGADDLVPDPASRFQLDDSDRRSTITDPAAYAWGDASWNGRRWNDVVLYETHIGTVTPEGTYAALAARLPALKETGVTAIELMPIAETTGRRTWGYDGVLPYAPNNAYGTPNELRHLVDTAHGLGLMIFLDVVYNHFGPSGNFLHGYAGTFFTDRHETPWGAAINVDGQGGASEVVREFFIQNAIYWLAEFHIDGLRLDAVHAIIDDSDTHFLDELASRVREHFPDRHVHLVLENEKNEASRLVRTGDHKAIAYDAQWDDDIHHCWHVLLTGEHESYYGDFANDPVGGLGRCLAEGFAYQGEYSPNLKHERGEKTIGLPPQAFVAFLQNHDQIGNRAQGDRLTTLAAADRLRLARAILLLSPQIPMIFMGDEWGATTPFQFFVNFENDSALEAAIRKGRAKEFESFKSFGGEEASSVIPDPTAVETFERSRLVWEERDRPPFADILKETRGLLTIRREVILPILNSGFVDARYERHGEAGLTVTWRFEGAVMTLVANFGDAAIKGVKPAGAEILWQSESPTFGEGYALSRWTGMLMRSHAA